MAVYDFFDRGWKRNPTGLAYVMGERTWTFDEAWRFTHRVAAALIDSGLPRGAKIGVLSPNDPAAWLCVIAAWRAGMVWVPLNPASPVSDSRRLLEKFDGSALIYAGSLEAAAAQLQAELPGLRTLVSLSENSLGHPVLADWVADRPAKAVSVPFDMDDVVAITPTGGTTGEPKGVMATHRNFSCAFVHLMMAFHYNANEEIRNLAAAPMTHTAGILSMPATARGGTVYVIERAEPRAVAAAIEQFRITDLFLPPTAIYRLLDLVEEHPHDFSSLRYFVYASAPMSVEKLRRAIRVFGPVMIEGYGQSEAPASIAYLLPEEHISQGTVIADERLSSCGRPMPLIAVEIRDDQDRPLPPGQAGEVCVRGDLVMKGYYKDPEKTAETIIDGWLHTGDVGHLDGQGYLYITDRKKDMIISGGFNVFPSEVEQVLWSHPAVNDCAVIGIPHPDWGESVTGVVELSPGRSVTTDELIAWCKERLGSIRAPKRIDIWDELPRSVNGKVSKQVIREGYWAGTGRSI